MKRMFFIFLVCFGCATIEPIKDQVTADNTRTDVLIDTLNDAPKTPQGRLVDNVTWAWLNTELTQCKADRVNKANLITSLNLQIQNKETEFLECTEQVNTYAKNAGKGEFVDMLLYTSWGGLAVAALLIVFLTIKNFSLKKLLVGGQ